MTNPYRAMCAELVDIITAHANPDDAAVGYVAGILTRARALLAKPEPEGPTVEELVNHVGWFADEACLENSSGDIADSCRELIARWGRPKPPSLNSIALQMLGTIERDAHYLPDITDTIRKALEALAND